MKSAGIKPDLLFGYMLKNNFKSTIEHFDRWWERKNGTILLVADLKRPGPVYNNIQEFTNVELSYERHYNYLKTGSFYGDTVPDMSSYLGPGSLCTFIGAQPLYSNKTIWYKEGCTTTEELVNNCNKFLNSIPSDFPWYEWSLRASQNNKDKSNGEYMASMPDLQQNLDIIAAVMGADRMFMEIMDFPEKMHELLEILYFVWEKAFNAHFDIIKNEKGYSAYTHYNIVGKGRTSVLQSDISCMMSKDMFNEYEMPYLRKQSSVLDNVIYHLDGPGAVRHLDSILSIDEINAVQWVPGAGNPGNADVCWHHLYDKIAQSDKGLYVFLLPEEIDVFLEKYGKGRILIRTLADSEEEQKQLVNKYSTI